jgi:hypothetical protein
VLAAKSGPLCAHNEKGMSWLTAGFGDGENGLEAYLVLHPSGTRQIYSLSGVKPKLPLSKGEFYTWN